MSGDVQPRKRKEKRRKKEDDDAGTPPPTLVNPAEHAVDNVTIHIYKEGSTGGHWCARIIFFALFTVLIGLVGVIIFEHRGTTDVDTPVTSSKWAVIFEGWVDDVFPFHDDGEHDKHDNDVSHEIDHDEEEEDEHEEEEEDDHEHENEEDEENDSGRAESEDQEEEDVEENDSNQIEEDEEAEEDQEDEGINDEEGETEAEDYENDDVEEDEGISNQQNDIEDEEEEGDEGIDSKAENDEGFGEDDDMGVLDEIDDHQNDENEEQNDNNDDDEEDITNISEPDLDLSIEGIKPSEKMDEDDIYEYVSIPGVNDMDDSTEPLEEVEEEEEEPEEIINEVEIEPLRDEVKQEEEETSVAVKFGVGVALVVAAHFVLVRRWKNVDDTPSVIDLSRRNTIVPPPDPKQLNIKGDVIQKQQQLKHLQELEPKYKTLPVEEIKIPYNKQLGAFQSIKNLPKREDQVNIPVLSKKDEPEFYTSESERFSGTEQESEYDEEDLDDEEDLEEDEEEELEEDEVEEVDDHELVAKLEAKYGKLATPSQSEEEELEDEEEYEEEEELEDEEEEEEKDGGNWKRPSAQQSMQSGVEKSKNKNTKEVPKTPPSSSRGGQQDLDFTEPVDNNDVNIQEEFEQWLTGDLDN